MLQLVLKNVRSSAPLIHCITNYVTVNDCANALLACGASPIMADDIAEAAEITTLCQATLLNIGTLNERTIKSMLLAGQKANEIGHPVVLDPAGAGASQLRTETAKMLLKNIKFSVIRGNISEIKTLALGSNTTQGVDANLDDKITDQNLLQTIQYLQNFSKQTGAIIAVSGAIDVVTNAESSYVIRNGHHGMSRITGSGCMLSCLTAAYIAANPQNPLDAVATAFVLMGMAGEKAAAKSQATGSMRTGILDAISELTTEDLKAGAKIEIY